MFRDQWNIFEEKANAFAGSIRDQLLERLKSSSQEVERIVKTKNPEERKKEFVNWGRDYVEELKSKAHGEKVQKAKENFFILLRNLGLNDQFIIETFQQNKKEVLDPLIGETVALVALVLGWKKQDKELFSQALGEIGVAGIFAAKPFMCLIAICGLAYGYQENFHQEAFKKGGVLGLAGVAAVTLSPGGFVGILAAVVTMLYLNKKLQVDRPIEKQVKEIFQQIKTGVFFKEMRGSWRSFEAFLSKLFTKESGIKPTI